MLISVLTAGGTPAMHHDGCPLRTPAPYVGEAGLVFTGGVRFEEDLAELLCRADVELAPAWVNVRDQMLQLTLISFPMPAR
jgi:hypothetical protein